MSNPLQQTIEALAKEKEAEGNGEAAAHPNDGWEALNPQSDQPPTLGKEIPVLTNRR